MNEKDMCPDCDIPLVHEDVWRVGVVPVCPECGFVDSDYAEEE